jgi:hypothetical protein
MSGLAGRRAGGLFMLIVLVQPASPSARLPAQQVAPNRATAYLFTTEVRDARAIWVNPAGLGALRDASIYAETSVGDPGSKGKLRQINAGFNARGLSFGYQHDVLDDGLRGNTYRLGIAGGSGGLALGADVARYAGSGTKATGWDIGTTYVALPPLTVGILASNIGQPVVRGIQQPFTFVPGFTWRPFSAFSFSTDARLTTDSVASYSFGLSWKSGMQGWPLALLARLDTDGDLRRGAFTFGLSLGARDQFGLMMTTPGDAAGIDQASLYGLSSREAVGGRR